VLQCVAVCCSVLQCVLQYVLQSVFSSHIREYSHIFKDKGLTMYLHMFLRLESANIFHFCFDIILYGVASVHRIDKIIGLFCKRAL